MQAKKWIKLLSAAGTAISVMAAVKKSGKVTTEGKLIAGRETEVVKYKDEEKGRFLTIGTTNLKQKR